jgi:PTS system fructose-specific IIC component
MPTQTTEFWKLFKPKACHLKLTGDTKDAVFEEIVTCLVKAGALAEGLAKAATVALIEREQLASTGVGSNVAIPHVKLPGLEAPVVSLSLHPEGVDWDALDGEPAHLFFAVLRPEGASDQYDPERHLQMMRWISRLGREQDFRNFAMASKTRTELVDLLKEMSAL